MVGEGWPDGIGFRCMISPWVTVLFDACKNVVNRHKRRKSADCRR